MSPARIQLRRTKGWKLPAGAVVVSRPSKWGNPHKLDALHPEHGWPMSREEAVRLFERDLRSDKLRVTVKDVRRELRGRTLACWCPIGQACHADVLLRVASESGEPCSNP